MASFAADIDGMNTENPSDKKPEKLNPNALSIADTVRLLNANASRDMETITEAMVQQDIKDGAPTNDDGTINYLHYVAWMTREYLHGRGPSESSAD